jgi:hypothetical protein
VNICLDAGYTGAQKIVEGKGYKAYIRSRGEEKQEKEKNPAFKAWWWWYEVRMAMNNRDPLFRRRQATAILPDAW